MKKKMLFLGLLIVVSFLISCSKDNHSIAKKLSISDDCVLIKKEGYVESNLLMIRGNSHEVEMVHYLDEEGNVLEGEGYSIYVNSVWEINEIYVAFSGRFSMLDEIGEDRTLGSIILNKKTGEFFKLHGHIDEGEMHFVDDAGNIYYKYENTVWQMQIMDNKANVKRYLPEGQTACRYIVDKQGNCLYTDCSSICKLMKSDGSISVKDMDIDYFWATKDGRMLGMRDKQNGEIEIVKFTQDGDFDFEVVGKGSGYFSTYYSQLNYDNNLSSFYNLKDIGYGGFIVDNDSYQIIKFTFYPKQLFFVKQNGSVLFFERESETGLEIKAFDFNSLNSFQEVTATNGSLKLKTFIQVPSDYEVYEYKIIDEDELTFKGLRYSDGKVVYCKVKGDDIFDIDGFGEDEYTVLTKID